MAMTSAQRTDAYRFFAIAFNAAPGATYMGQLFDAYTAGMTTQQIVNVYTTKPEFTATYPTYLTDTDFATKLVNNIVKASATAAAKAQAVSDIVASLGLGKSRGDVIYTIFNNLANKSLSDADWGNTAKQMANQVVVAQYYTETLVGNTTSLSTLQAVIANVTNTTDVSTAAAIEAVIGSAGGIGQTFTLTTGVDSGAAFTGGTGNDTFIASYNSTSKASTLGALDSLNGGGGTDTLDITYDDGAAGAYTLAGATIANIENVTIRGGGAVTADTTQATITGVTKLASTQSAAASLTAGSTTAIEASGATGAVTLTGGSTQTVSLSKLGGALAQSKAAGAITTTVGDQNGNTITIDGGTTVNLTSTQKTAEAAAAIKIGNTTKPSGAVAVSAALSNDGATAAADLTGSAITVNGGTTVSVTQTATSGATSTNAGTNYKVVQGAVTVNGGAATTSVTVNQSATVTTVTPTKTAVTGVAEVDTVQFGALAATKTVVLGGLTLTAPAGGLTAKQVAAAFANLANGQLTGWTSGAVSGTGSDTVTFTQATTGGAIIADTGTGAATTITTKTAAVVAVTAQGTGGVDVGGVTIADGGTGTIATVNLSNYGNSTITSDALATLSLTNSSADAATGTLGVTNAKATTLDLTVNGGANGLGAVNVGATYTKLNAHTTGTDTAVAVTGAGVTTLTVDGTNVLDLTGSAFAALKTVAVSGAAGLTGDFSGATVTDVNASATSGAMTVTINATKATYEGGSGVDKVTIDAAPTKAISGGAGSSDVLVLNVAAATFSNPSANTNISGFEILGLGAAATGSYDATGFIGLTEGGVTGAVTYTNVAGGAPLFITAAPGWGTTYTLKDATGTSDALTINVGKAVAANTITANGIESVTIATNSATKGNAASLTLVDDAVKTITLTGGSTFTLTSTNKTVTSVDASAMTGSLSYTAAGTVAETIKGGAGANTLGAATGATTADVLIGGAANDTITANKGLDTLTGNGGNDTFVIVASANVNSYATITDANAGDQVKLVDLGAETFAAAKISLAPTAVFQDYANAAINAGGDASANAYIAWFQYGGDTYIVESMHNATTTLDFQNGTDAIVKLTGLVDLSTATLFNIGAAPVVAIH